MRELRDAPDVGPVETRAPAGLPVRPKIPTDAGCSPTCVCRVIGAPSPKAARA